MFDLSVNQQLPPSVFHHEDFKRSFQSTIALVSAPFHLEEAGKFNEAIEAHKGALKVLKALVHGTSMRKFNRKMYERQAEVHKERAAYLESLAGNYSSVVTVPSRASSQNTPISHATGSMSSIPIAPGTAPIEYIITHTSELVDAGVRSHWFFVKDSTSTHTLYAAQGVWDMDKPMIEAVLRRSDEFFPLGGIIHASILKRANGNFKMRMHKRGVDEDVCETPLSSTPKGEWSPRQFSLGEKHFVWKNEGGKDSGMLSKKWSWETLYQATGPDGEAQGARLVWGKTTGRIMPKWKIFMVPWLDQDLREYVFASQLSRLLRWSYPPEKDLAGVESGAATAGVISAIVSFSELLELVGGI